MRWFLAFHVITMVAWFAGLFYLPRLFVYHAKCQDAVGSMRFIEMERKLLYYIMTPAGILTTALGLLLWVSQFQILRHLAWMWAKLFLVSLVWGYHFCCMALVGAFRENRCVFSVGFYRLFNEIPTILLCGIVILVEVQPTFRF